MEEKQAQHNKKSQRKSFETDYDPIQKCILFKIVDIEGLSPFFLIEHPKAGIYRVNLGDNGLHVTR
ncbi:hypothetical protein KA005_49020 [bacterium]|nr:hypothetical protein [bacterium]